MGCDAHCYVEIIEKFAGGHQTNGEYTLCFATDIWLGRNYILYGLMAGVRGKSQLFNPKGVPNNTSLQVQRIVNEWGSDGHSHTWFSIEDLWKISDEYEKLEGTRYRNLDAILAMMIELETENNTPRLIVFFDN